jgi:hypothetical protein
VVVGKQVARVHRARRRGDVRCERSAFARRAPLVQVVVETSHVHSEATSIAKEKGDTGVDVGEEEEKAREGDEKPTKDVLLVVRHRHGMNARVRRRVLVVDRDVLALLATANTAASLALCERCCWRRLLRTLVRRRTLRLCVLRRRTLRLCVLRRRTLRLCVRGVIEPCRAGRKGLLEAATIESHVCLRAASVSTRQVAACLLTHSVAGRKGALLEVATIGSHDV